MMRMMSSSDFPAPADGLKARVRALPRLPGVYLMRDRMGTVLYVGKAKDLRKRVASYFQPSRRSLGERPKIVAMMDLVADVEVLTVRSEPEAILLEGKLIKQFKPKYNTDFVDDKRFLMVRVEPREPLPRFELVRNRLPDAAQYFGPFADAGALRKTLAEMRRRFGVLLGDAKPVKLSGDCYRLYDDMRSEIYGAHANEVSGADYRERVVKACAFLEGKSREWLKEVEKRMKACASDFRYEEAAQLRDVLLVLRKTLAQTRKFVREPALGKTPVHAALESLGNTVGLADLPAVIECFDISHISGTFTVASMVRFRDGKPDRSQYRRFRIQSFEGNDDFRAMEEVVGRRYRRMRDEGRPLPDLVVIDGGKGQVTAALRAFLILDMEPLPLIGLAKKRETIIFADERPPLNLPLRDPSLQLLQRLRDEAHRFANSFSAELRSRRLRESVLDRVTGLGPKRKQLLMDHFGTVEAIRRADAGALAEVPGIGPAFAAKVAEALRKRTRDAADRHPGLSQPDRS